MDKNCTILVAVSDKSSQVSANDLKMALEKGSDAERVQAMKKVIALTLNGESLPGILMTVIRFVMTSRNHALKKLNMIYLEVIEKVDAEGRLKPEMILVCNALRNDLTHPNEYVRGATCRFLCKIRDAELLEPLIPSVRANLEHRHAYVRRNAVFCIYSVYKLHDGLIPDAPELIADYIAGEGDASCKRNAFIFLIHCAPEKAVDYLAGVLDQVESMGEVLQFTVVELVRKLVRTSPALRGKYIRVIFSLLKSSSASVRFEAAHTLVLLSSAPSAIRAAASCYIDLLCNDADNNVKLIVLDRLVELKKRHPKVMSDLLLDVLRALNTPSLDIRRKTLAIALDLVSLKNIDEVVQVLKKEIGKTQAAELEQQGEYRQMLIQAVHTCAVKFPDVAHSVVHLMMDFLGDANVASAVDVIVFVREVVETYPDLRESIVSRLLEAMDSIRSSKVFRAALWIVGEYATGKDEVTAALSAIKECMGEPPFVKVEAEEVEVEDDDTSKPTGESLASKAKMKAAGPKLNPDGTYASQSALMDEYSVATAEKEKVPNLRALLLTGDFFLGTVVSSTMTKLTLKVLAEDAAAHKAHAEALMYMAAILRLGKSSTPPHTIDRDSYDRIVSCMRILLDRDPAATAVFLRQCRASFKHMLRAQNALKEKARAEAAALEGGADEERLAAPDECLKIRQLRNKRTYGGGASDVEDEDEVDLSRATGAGEDVEEFKGKETRLNRIVQLTGFSDPIFAEAYVTVHQYDIMLEISLTNQTGDTLQNVCLELATLGDLKLVERPQYLTIGPLDTKTLKASIKVSSTETGVIFGSVVYDIAGASASDNTVVLADIHVDVCDYLVAATCTEVEFRSMWSEFEWENRVSVSSSFADVDEYLAHIIEATKMNCLTPTSNLSGKCGFISANLYAKSLFGEHALMNVNIQSTDGKISGNCRIRSKRQGIALSLGEVLSAASLKRAKAK